MQEILDRIRPAVQIDGGDSEFVDVEGGVVKLTLQGACVGCPSLMMALKMGIEEPLMDGIPGVNTVVALKAAQDVDRFLTVCEPDWRRRSRIIELSKQSEESASALQSMALPTMTKGDE